MKGVNGIKECNHLKKLCLNSHYAGYIESNKSKLDKFYDISKKAIEEMLDDAQITRDEIRDMGIRASFSFASCNFISYDLEKKLLTEKRENMLLGQIQMFYLIL